MRIGDLIKHLQAIEHKDPNLDVFLLTREGRAEIVIEAAGVSPIVVLLAPDLDSICD